MRYQIKLNGQVIETTTDRIRAVQIYEQTMKFANECNKENLGTNTVEKNWDD